MKRVLIFFFSLVAIAGLSAHHHSPMRDREFGRTWHTWEAGDDYFLKTETKAIEGEIGRNRFGDLTLNELRPYLDRLSIAEKKDEYVEGSAFSSFMLPGLGQFRNGNLSGGLGFLGLHLLAVAGTVAGAYFLLPADLRFDRLDYMNQSSAEIDKAWQSKRIVDFLPSVGAIVAGVLVDMGIRFFAARSAADDAKNYVSAGKVSFEPELSPFFMGINVRMR